MKHLCSLLLTLSLATCAQASILGVNFEQAGTNSGDELAATESTGVIPSTNWNNINVGSFGSHAVNIPATTLNDNSGTLTTATIASNLGSAYVALSNSGNSTADHTMMNGYVSWDPVDGTTPEDSGTITIANLPADYTTPGYSVYIYFDSNANNRTFDITIGGTTVTGTDSSTFSGTFHNAATSPSDANYAVITGLNTPGFTIAMNSNTGRAAINGFQIVSNNHPLPPTIEAFVATDHYVNPGSPVTLNWKTTGSTTITIDQGVGDVTPLSTNGDGNTTIYAPASSTTYTLTATSSGGSTQQTLKLGVGPDRPNILLFIVDDMGTQDTSEPFIVDNLGADVPTSQNSLYRTPSMETLATQGMKFTQAYAMPVCSPSRCSLMNGQNSVRHHVTNWTNVNFNVDNDQNSTTSHNSPSSWRRIGLDTSTPTLPSILSNAGYRSIHVGKAHFGNASSNDDPINCGFDINIAGSSIGQPGSYTGDYGQGGSRPVPHLDAYHNTSTFLTEALTLEMNKAIEASVNDGVPFFAYMSHYALHAPFHEDSRFSSNYPTLSGNARAFAALVEGMDKSLGDIMTKLDQLGVAEDTLVIFLSDNGSDNPHSNASAPLRGKKGTKWEGGSRIPMIVGWSKINASNPFQSTLNIPANSHEDDIVTIFDLFPTILSVANVGHTNQIDGHDLREYLKGTPGSHRPQELLIHFPHDHNSDYYTFLREGDYKLIYHYASNHYTLYNLATDTGETTDIAAANPERTMAMARKMAQLLDEHDAQWPTFDSTPDYDDPFAMPTLPGVDLDNDNIDDNTEDSNKNGIVDPGETDPDNDNTDGDNLKDNEEAAIGTDPLDPNSYFSINQTILPGGDLQLTWKSAPGSSFSIRSSTDLIDWSTIVAAAVPASAGTTTSYNLGSPSSLRIFYRAEIE